MPTYEYECLRCSEKFERQWRFGDDERKIKCPKCGSENLRRIVARDTDTEEPANRPLWTRRG